MSATRPETSPLDRMVGILWGDTDGRAEGASRLRQDRGWLVLPSARSPTLLVPADRRTGSAALLQFNDSMTWRARSAKAGLSLAIRTNLAAPFVRDRFQLPADVVRNGAGLIEDELPRLFGVPRVEVAISLGQALRPNVKPVLRVMSPDGRVLGFVKVAWNELTSDLVENEIRILSRIETDPTRSFRAPRVIHRGEHGGWPFAVLSPLPHPLRRRWPTNAMPSTRLFRDVSELADQKRLSLADGPYWRDVTRRARVVVGYSGAPGRFDSALDTLAADIADVEVVHAMGHGDLAPWNMLHTRASVSVWDWERASEGRPLGVDAIHFAFEVMYQRERRDPRDAAEVTLARSGHVLDELGVSGPGREAVRDVYILDRLTRLLEGLRAGVSVDRRLTRSLVTYFIEKHDARARSPWLV